MRGAEARSALPPPPRHLACRQLLLFPRGNKLNELHPKTSLYLTVPTEDDPCGWYRCANFSLTLLSEGGEDIFTGGRGEWGRGTHVAGRGAHTQAPPCLLLRGMEAHGGRAAPKAG